MENSKIEWTKHTANLWIGCTEVHAGCDNCYARVLNNRWGNAYWGNDAPRRAVKKVWNDFKKWQREAEKLGEVHRVFVGSMMDIAERSKMLDKPILIGDVEFVNTEQLRQLFYEVVVPQSPNLMFLLLTKRPSNFNNQIPTSWLENPPPNVIFGTSPVNQETADKLIPQLLEVKGRHFLSVEPMLDETFLIKHLSLTNANKIDWVICGGESGHGKREFNPDWARSLRDECEVFEVPFFMKQWDKVKAIPDDLMIREFPINKQ